MCALALLSTVTFPSDADLHKLLAQRVTALAADEQSVGIVVGLVGPQGRRVVAYGHLGRNDPRTLGGDTGFEIGSITKVFTALLLAEMVRRNEVALTDPVVRYLPAAVIPSRGGRPITLLDLATHTSGLPFMPDGMPALDAPSPTPYGAAQLFEFLAHQPPAAGADPGWEYSNVGYWLLGEALASRAGMDFERLLRTRVIDPLKLGHTAITVSSRLKAQLAAGHNAALQPSPSISTVPVFAAMPAAGGLASTAADMSRFLSAAMGYERSPLAPALAAMLGTRRPMQPGTQQALGWIVIGEGDDELIVHDGGTLGFASSVAWDPRARLGVVVLSNQMAGVSDIARHLLRPSMPLETPAATKRTEIALDAAALDSCVGRYEAPGEGVFTIAREREGLTIELPADWGLPRLRLRPESPRDFFAVEVPLRATFQTDAGGRVNALLVHPPRGQKAILANRIPAS